MPMAQQLQNLMAPQTPLPGQMSGPNMPIPGSLTPTPKGQDPGNNQTGDKGVLAPIPGQAPGGKDGDKGKGLAMNTGKDGNQQGSGAGGMLTAPIPGLNPGMNAPGAGLGGVPGAGSAPGAGGGKDAGSGTMDMFEQKSEITAANKESRVATQLNEGDSEFRTVEGGAVKSETAKLSRKEIVINFIDTEEEALDEQTLPLTRRNQVLRYFSEIRRQLEEAE
jgi:hypothetical protein